jgi:hypothetical protein
MSIFAPVQSTCFSRKLAKIVLKQSVGYATQQSFIIIMYTYTYNNNNNNNNSEWTLKQQV